LRAWGADGCKKGWFHFALGDRDPEFGVVPTLIDLVERAGPSDPIFVDIPIGLHDASDRERRCDLDARRVLSPHRGSSVFPAPARSAVHAETYEEATRRNREALGKGLSRQSWGIAPKIREVDELLRQRSELVSRVREVHPEVCFWALYGAPMPHSKKTREGFRARIDTVGAHLPSADELVAAAYLEHGGFDAARDDIVDALVAALTAAHAAECLTLPATPEVDPQGIPMEIVYWPGHREGGPDSRSTGRTPSGRDRDPAP
jgi:predicted RNase H-like nuclease